MDVLLPRSKLAGIIVLAQVGAGHNDDDHNDHNEDQDQGNDAGHPHLELIFRVVLPRVDPTFVFLPIASLFMHQASHLR